MYCLHISDAKIGKSPHISKHFPPFFFARCENALPGGGLFHGLAQLLQLLFAESCRQAAYQASVAPVAVLVVPLYPLALAVLLLPHVAVAGLGVAARTDFCEASVLVEPDGCLCHCKGTNFLANHNGP